MTNDVTTTFTTNVQVRAHAVLRARRGLPAFEGYSLNIGDSLTIFLPDNEEARGAFIDRTARALESLRHRATGDGEAAHRFCEGADSYAG